MGELDVRYVKLHFTAHIVSNTILPINKTSALRGGMGEMLLRANCIRDRKCEECDFYSECIVQRTMYSQFDDKPEYITKGDSVGYVIECEDYREEFKKGDFFEFNLILFGKTIVYFNQYITAFYALGQNGLGNNKSQFIITKVTNTKNEDILFGNNIDMSKYKISTIANYVDYRLKQINSGSFNNTIKFKTAATIKYQGKFIDEFSMEAIIPAIQRRLYMLDCFEAIWADPYFCQIDHLPRIVSQRKQPISVRRFSNRKEQAMYMKGIKGEIVLDEIPTQLMPLLLAGELFHIGKNTSFGFGRYKLF